MADSTAIRELQAEFKRLMDEARQNAKQNDGEAADLRTRRTPVTGSLTAGDAGGALLVPASCGTDLDDRIIDGTRCDSS